MRAGELDRKVLIEAPTSAKGSAGGLTQTWSTFATVWAGKRPLRGAERFAAAQVNAENDVVFRIRWVAGVTHKMRINDDGVLWDIQHIAEIGRREGLDITARLHQA